MISAAKKSGATVLSHTEHNFQPSGYTALVLLSESHLSVHTYPDERYIALDAFTCGDSCNPVESIRFLREILKPEEVHLRVMKRGLNNECWEVELVLQKNEDIPAKLGTLKKLQKKEIFLL